MSSAPDYGFYSSDYGGALDEESFRAALPHAVSSVRRIIWPNDPDELGAADEYRRAVCAACDVDAEYGLSGGAGAPSSVTAGNVSMSFGGADRASSYDADVARAVEGELAGTGLLFSGMG